jgi:hypothetical protein
MTTDDTFVIGIKNDRITFIKTFHYETEKDEAQKALAIVQDESLYDAWEIGHVGGYILESKTNNEMYCPISVPIP